MALVTCYECGRTISERAIACPSCGAPRPHLRISDEPLPIWIDRLADADPSVRLRAIQEIAVAGTALRDTDAIPAMIRFMQESEGALATYAIVALGLTRDPAAVAPIIERLEASPELFDGPGYGHIEGWERQLSGCTGIPPSIPLAGMIALGNILDRSAIPFLRRVAAVHGPSHLAANDVLKRLGEVPVVLPPVKQTTSCLVVVVAVAAAPPVLYFLIAN